MKRRNLFRGFGALLASAFSWTGLVKARQEQPVARIRTIDIVSDGNAPYPFPMPEVQEVSVPIKNFDPVEAEQYVYHVREIRERGGGGGSATPDENGVLTISRPKRASSADWAPQYYYYSVNKTNGEKRYTFDLVNVPLADLVRSLQLSTRNWGSPYSPPSFLFPPPDPRSNPPVSLTAENVTLQETLDLLRRGSGCDVTQADGKLTIDRCG